MYDWLLNDAHLVLLVLIFVALITIVVTLTRVRRAEFARLQNEVKQILDCVKSLEAAEQRRFIVELKSNCAGGEPASATKVVAISESGPPDEEPAKPKPSLRFEQTVESGSDEGKARRKKRRSRDKAVTPAQDIGNVLGPTTT